MIEKCSSVQNHLSSDRFLLNLEEPMTVIAAMKLDEDTWLLAADSFVTEKHLLRQSEKVHIREEDPLVAFGFSGFEGVGLQFQEWFLGSEWPEDTTWEQLAHGAGTRLSKLNGQSRERARLAGLSDVDENTASVLLVGSVGGDLDCWELTDTGGISPANKIGFWGIGSGWPHAGVAYHTLTEYGKLQHELKTMAIIMDIVVRCEPNCGFPVSIYRVTKEKICKIVSGSDGDWNEYEEVSGSDGASSEYEEVSKDEKL